MSNLASKITLTTFDVPDVLLVRPKRLDDERGYFTETFNAADFGAIGITSVFVQDNQSVSTLRGTVRGLHFQAPPHAQAKLVRVVYGRAFDVAVDIRKDSPSYGRWCAAMLTAEGGEQLFLPRGFAHAVCTLEPNTIVAYKVDDYYNADSEAGLFWNDPDIAIAWPIEECDVVLSARDARLPRLKFLDSPFRF